MRNQSFIVEKTNIIMKCMELLSKAYLPESGVYKNVKKGLHKLSLAELNGLYAMLLSSR
jgi:hypothetical protein